MTEQDRIELIEDRIPLVGIRETAEDLVEINAGTVTSASDRGMSFTLPSRRGLPSAGEIECRMAWTANEENLGTVTLSCTHAPDRPKFQQIAILGAGVIGAVLWMLWPFFPGLGAASWIGAVMAFGAWWLTLKRSNPGVAAEFLQRLAAVQRETD